VALDLARELARQLKEAGMEARLTRTDDTLIPLWDRAKLANEAGANLFISLHLNAAPVREARGSEVYFLSMGNGDRMAAQIAAVENAGARGKAEQNPESVVAGILSDLSQKAFLQDSERLAVAIQVQLNLLGGIKERGVKQAPFVVLRGAAMPAVLVETAFISNPREEAKLMDPGFRKRVAQAIARGVRRFLAGGTPLTRRAPSQGPPAG
jgi:N-acetylmuramoyl-L-alanine amidase